MLAKDVMTTEVVSVSPETSVSEIARLFLKHHISAVPVIDEKGDIAGIVSEGDLMHRPESDTEIGPRSWWLRFIAGNHKLAQEFSKSHGQYASDVMTKKVTSVQEETPVGEIAQLLEEQRIKRVPVVRDGKLVGIVSRANLLHGLATWRSVPAGASDGDDNAVRERVLQEMGNQTWTQAYNVNITVDDGAVHLWGIVGSPEIRDALAVLVKEVSGVKAVENHLGFAEAWMYWGE